VDTGEIVGVTNFFRGPSRPDARGYGVFPASFRTHVSVNGTNVDWDAPDYSPVAFFTDKPSDTLPGLGSPGVTLEFGGLWKVSPPASIPDSSGILCALQLSEPATVSIAPNVARGGVISANPDNVIEAAFDSAAVNSVVSITGITVADGNVTITFVGGELETATDIGGEWTGTGNSTGTYNEPVETTVPRFFRVVSP
jgi:hypothetical protein